MRAEGLAGVRAGVRAGVTAHSSMPDEFVMRQNTMKEFPNNPKLTSPSYLTQAQSTSSLLCARYGAIPYSSSKQIHNQYRPCAMTGRKYCSAVMTPDTSENLKPNSGFQQSIPNLKTKFRMPNTKCHNLQELMYRFQYQKHSVSIAIFYAILAVTPTSSR